MSVLYVAEEHDQILGLWRKQDARSLRVLHVDFHCDMSGLLINRCRGLAHRILERHPSVHAGNFLTHAILEGRVERVRWVHDVPGGRRDDLSTVKYENDLTALPYRLFNALKRRPGIALEYEELIFRDWTGPEPGEFLDIDWDFFACTQYPAETINSRVDAFFQKDFQAVPDQMHVCYSDAFSHPSRGQFEAFIARLANRFNAKIVRLQHEKPRPASTPAFKATAGWQGARRAYTTFRRSLRRWGIY